jgi:hypothetical protein
LPLKNPFKAVVISDGGECSHIGIEGYRWQSLSLSFEPARQFRYKVQCFRSASSVPESDDLIARLEAVDDSFGEPFNIFCTSLTRLNCGDALAQSVHKSHGLHPL